ncbi:hypothetical protein QJS66_21030 [Kocuria rhizophila]|nr:hypothetical protein QJS66_21030 [Kocuria rhizophila]
MMASLLITSIVSGQIVRARPVQAVPLVGMLVVWASACGCCPPWRCSDSTVRMCVFLAGVGGRASGWRATPGADPASSVPNRIWHRHRLRRPPPGWCHRGSAVVGSLFISA